MFQRWRRKVREAERAAQAGRLRQAGEAVTQPELAEFYPARKLRDSIARHLVERGGQAVERGQTSAGWRDLEAAVVLAPEADGIDLLRDELVSGRLAEAEQYVKAGEAATAVARLDELARRTAMPQAARILRDVASKMWLAQRHMNRGRFAEAETELTAARTLRPDVQVLDRLLDACRVKAGGSRELSQQLHVALSVGEWTGVLRHAESLLELCPEHEPAREARRQAWAVVGVASGPSPKGFVPRPSPQHKSPEAVMSDVVLDVGAAPPASPRFLLWIDGVGGYLVCPGADVVVGQPVPGSAVDVPIQADISRRHVRIRREGENYLLVPLRTVRVGNEVVSEPRILQNGAIIDLGGGVKLRFVKSHAFSGTARLDVVSHHRTQPAVDGVLLMADACVLGPGTSSHVQCPELGSEVVLFRQGDGLCCRAAGNFTVDGQACQGRATLSPRSQVVGSDFSFSIEPV